MSPPVPGIMPVNTPIKLERRIVGISIFSSDQGRITLSLKVPIRSAASSSFSIKRNTWGMENRPISATVNGMPENR